MWVNNGLAILPNLNILSNIGFGPNSTHTKDEVNKLANLTVYNFTIDMHHKEIVQNIEADIYTYQYFFAPKPFWVRVINKMKKLW